MIPEALFKQLPQDLQSQLTPMNLVSGKRETPRAQYFLTGHRDMTLRQALQRFPVRTLCDWAQSYCAVSHRLLKSLACVFPPHLDWQSKVRPPYLWLLSVLRDVGVGVLSMFSGPMIVVHCNLKDTTVAVEDSLPDA